MKKKFFLAVFLLIIFFPSIIIAHDSRTQEFQGFLKDLKKQFVKLDWNDLAPEEIAWEYHRSSSLERPLFFTHFGDHPTNTTIFLGGVHGDECSSVYVSLKLAQHLKAHPEISKKNYIVVAPLVNPDGFFANPQTRTNARGVDINRNFPTRDWRNGAKGRYYPGPRASSENETKFQIALFHRFRPVKIVSIHSPLGRYDYDGPSSDLDDFVQWLKKSSGENHFPLRRYRVFPGSLGNYAGMERKIHTLTLELPSSIPKSGPDCFDQFRKTLVEILDQRPSGRPAI